MAKRRKRKGRNAGSWSQGAPKLGIGLIAGAIAVGVLVLAGAYFLISADTQTPAQVAQVTEDSAVENAPQPVVEETAPDLPVAPKVGALAPDFTLADTTGNQVSLADFRGKPAVVTFFHTW